MSRRDVERIGSERTDVAVVLDSWAVLAYLGDDGPAAQAVDDLLANERPVMSWINLGEVFSIVRRRHGEQRAATATRNCSPRTPRGDG